MFSAVTRTDKEDEWVLIPTSSVTKASANALTSTV
jgi:hypothetical protein